MELSASYSNIVQGIVAVLFVFVIYLISLSVMSIDELVDERKSRPLKPKTSTVLIDGIAAPRMLKNLSFNVVNPLVSNYQQVSPSINMMGGTQFTYQMWVYIEDTKNAPYHDLILLLKGDYNKYQLAYYVDEAHAEGTVDAGQDGAPTVATTKDPVSVVTDIATRVAEVAKDSIPSVIQSVSDPTLQKAAQSAGYDVYAAARDAVNASVSKAMMNLTSSATAGDAQSDSQQLPTDVPTKYMKVKEFAPDYYVACPMIRFTDSFKNLEVRVNTSRAAAVTFKLDSRKDSQSSMRKNLMSVMPKNWTLLTFVFNDSYSSSTSFENGIQFKFYVNDQPYFADNPSSSPILHRNFIRQNDGNIHLFPNLGTGSDFMKVAGIKYMNYSVSDSEVKSTFYAGPPKKKFSDVEETDKAWTPSLLSASNKIDLNNM